MSKTIELAGCVVTNTESNILLVHRNTEALTQWELPGGKVRPGEEKHEAASREVFEETALIVNGLTEIRATKFQQDGRNYNYTWFWPEEVTGVPRAVEDIHDQLSFFAPDKIRGRGFSPNVRALAKLLLKGKIELPHV